MGKDAGSAEATSSGVYVLDKEFAWVPARLIEQSGEKATVSIPTYEDEASILTDGGKGAKSWREETVNLKHYPGKTLPLQNMVNGQLNEKQDMVDLPFLHEVRSFFRFVIGSFAVISDRLLDFITHSMSLSVSTAFYPLPSLLV